MPREPAIEERSALIEAVYPQSPLQSGMLFHHLYGAAAGVDIQQIVADLREPLSVPLFEQAWRHIIARHAVLRTAFQWGGGDELAQAVYRDVACPVAFEDWRALPAAEQAARLAAYCRDDLRRGFILDQAPLMRLAVFQRAAADFRFVWTFHHALIDGRSYDLLLREVFGVYEGLLQGEALTTPARRPYRDYVRWLQRQNLAASEPFWRDLLAGFGGATGLPDIPPAVAPPDADDYGMQELWLSEELTAAMAAVARERRLSGSTLVQGAWALLLSRVSGEDDVVVGVTRTCRHSALDGDGADEMIGLLINTLPLRARIVGSESVAAWLQSLRAQSLAVRAHEHTPLAALHEWSNVRRGESLFESIVVFENYRLDTRLKTLGGGWVNRDFDVFGRTSYPLTLLAYQDQRLLLRLKYDRARFDDDAVRRLLGSLASLLGQIVADPGQALDELSLLSRDEAEWSLSEWDGPWEDTADLCFHEVFEAQAERTPDAPAVQFEDAALTYSELNVAANHVAHRLRTEGIGPESVVGIYVERSVESIVALLGILKAGGAYLPLDLGLPQERLKLMLDEARVVALVTSRALLDRLPRFDGPIVCVDAVDEDTDGQNLPNLARPANLAYLLFTSGSTGRPKGVAVEHRQLMSYLNGVVSRLDLPRAASYALVSTFAADLGNTMIFPSLALGGCLHIISAERAASPDDLAAYFDRHAIDCLKIVPSHLAALLSAGEPARVLPRRRLILGGEAASAALVARVQALAPDCRVFNHYGPTETTVGVLTHAVLPGGAAGPIPLGRSLPNTRAYILDRAMQPMPVGMPGELYIGGATVARGYVHRPDLTAERFVPNPHATGGGRDERLYRTGDRARQRGDGAIEFLGRMDDQVKIRGYRVEPAEIAAVLTLHPSVALAAVLPWDDERGEKRLAAYVVPSDAASLDNLLPTLAAFLRERLPEHMIPAAIVPLAAIPLTANGKIDRRALPAPGFTHAAPSAYVAPRTDAEKALARVWADVLAVDRVGIHDNFFELGGDSIISIRILARARRAGFHLSPRQIFEHPTIAELAAVLAEPATTGAPGRRNVPLTPYQRSLLAASPEEAATLCTVRVLRAGERLDPQTLVAALRGLAAHHDALRLRVARDGETPQGWETDADNAISLTHARLAGTGRSIEEAIDALAADLDSAKGVLCRVGLFETEEGKSVVAIAAHSLIVDAPSWPILVADLDTAYRQAQRGEAIHLPASASFIRWAGQLAHYAETEAPHQRDYWESLAPLEAAVRRERGGRHEVRVVLSEEETRTFLEAQTAYRTRPEEMLLAATGLALAAHLEGDCLVEIEADARGALPGFEVERGVGCFSAAFPFRLDLPALREREQQSLGDVLVAIKEGLRRVPDGGIGYGALRGDMAVPASARSCYLGVVDTPLPADGLWEAVTSPGGPALWDGVRPIESSAIQVVARVEAGRLSLVVDGAGAWDRAATDGLAESLFRELKTLAYHCVSIGAGSYTPSDFPDADLSQDELDELLSSL